jgi:hypothetical protein
MKRKIMAVLTKKIIIQEPINKIIITVLNILVPVVFLIFALLVGVVSQKLPDIGDIVPAVTGVKTTT